MRFKHEIVVLELDVFETFCKQIYNVLKFFALFRCYVNGRALIRRVLGLAPTFGMTCAPDLSLVLSDMFVVLSTRQKERIRFRAQARQR